MPKRPYLQQVATLADFFGSSLHEVSNLNRYIAIYGGRPEWLRNLKDEKALPKRVPGELRHRFVAPPSEGGRATLVVWLVENARGSWNISDRWVWLDDDVDAVYYKLRFT